MASTISFGNNNSGFQAGAIHGPVHNTFHNSYATARPEAPAQPSIVIPFARDTDFVERGTICEDLRAKCATPDSWTALVGLGGVGKSQLAIEHAYRTHQASPETWVLWVYASNAARYEQSFRDMADAVKLAGRQDPQANIFKLVHDWLRECKHRWLLVLDNVDDARFLLNPPAASTDAKTASKPLRDYLPHCERGSVLITTRNKEAALKLVEHRDVIAIGPMDKASAVALLEKKLGTPRDSSEIAELAAALEYMPLAIVQATAYILQRTPRYTVTRYLDEYRKSERKRTSLLGYAEGHLRRDGEAKNSIIVTWQMSFEHIRQTRPSAADLLSLMSFFDRQGIPEAVLRWRDKQQDDDRDQQEPMTEAADSDGEDDASQSSTSVDSEEDTFEDDVVILRNFCFISDETDGKSFKMHELVQLATRIWLTANGELEQWKQQFVTNLRAAFPTGEYENWALCQKLFVHAKMAATHELREKSSLLDWATLMYCAAWYAWQRGDAADSQGLALKSLRARQKVCGEEHEDTLSSMGMVGLAYHLGGHWRKAVDIEVRKMNASKVLLGPDHPNTLSSMTNLASTYLSQGRWKDAEKLQVEVLERSNTTLEDDNPHTLSSMNSLATTYRIQGRWEDAEKLDMVVVQNCNIVFGPDHPKTLSSMANLASTYWSQGRWKDAEKLQVEVLERGKTKLGNDHPDTLMSITNLALTYWSQGRWKDAEKLQVEVLKTSKKILGGDHPDTLSGMHNLALTYWKQGRLEDAEKLSLKVLEVRKTTLGPDHPDTLSSMANLASTNRDQGRWEDAEKLFAEVLETCKTKLAADHLDTLTSMANLASIYRDQGQLKNAEQLEVQTVEASKTKLGAGHPHTLSGMANLALTYWKQGRLGDAEKLEVEVLEMRKAKLGADHPHTITTMNNLALTYYDQGRWEEAEKLGVEVLKTRKIELGQDHPHTLNSMHNLALTWRSLGRSAEAIALMQQCAQQRRQVLGENHPHLVSSLRVSEQWEAEEAEAAEEAG